jgi:flavin reductase (DIM6/NTAB) family NADH-FMN oxidoreductase RutF
MNAFEGVVGDLEYPMFIVTAPGPLGCLVGFTTQCSIDPPRFMVCLSHQNRTFREGQHAEALGIHAVPADAGDLAELFGGHTQDTTDKFDHTAWHPGPRGVPILERCRNWFVGHVLNHVDAGDHDAFLLEPIAGESGQQEEFTFHRAKRIEPGHDA